MAKVSKRTWQTKKGEKTCWVIDYKDEQGHRFIKSGFKTKVKAEQELTKILNEIDTGSYVKENKTLTFKGAFSYYLQHGKIHFKENTIISHKAMLNKHVMPFFSNKKLSSISAPMFKKWIAERIESGISEYTINYNIKVCKAIFNILIKDGIISKNPLEHIQKLKEPKKEPRFITTQEIKKIISIAEDSFPKFYPLLCVAIFTGMRQGEILSLTWDDINWEQKKIIINKSYSKGKLTTPKTSTSVRQVDMTVNLVKILKYWQLKCPCNELNLVFPNSVGNYINATNLYRDNFAPLFRKAKIAKMRFHDLRHTYASLLIAKNVPIKYIQTQMGHSSIKVTMDIYGHLMPEVNERVSDVLDKMFSQKNEISKLNRVNSAEKF